MISRDARSARSFIMTASDARIQVEVASSLAEDRPAIRDWIQDGIHAVEAYYGRFPVSDLTLRIEQAGQPGVHGGKSFGYPAPLVSLNIGAGTTAPQFRADWMLTHELVHLTFPSMAEQQSWAHEGLATYIEPLARHQAGQLPAEKVWRDLVEGLPHGTRELARAGLDENGSWGATYWGGAIFWFLADIEIRERSGQRNSLKDALQGILVAGGSSRTSWSLRETLLRGDHALGISVLLPLYERMHSGPQHIDLDALWRELGVDLWGGVAQFRDEAPRAAIRQGIAR